MSKIYLIDANVILRLLVGDEPKQKRLAEDFFEKIYLEENKGVVSIQVIGEVLWIMEGYYNLKRSLVVSMIKTLLLNRSLTILEMKKSSLMETLDWYVKTNLDFTDVYLIELHKLSGIELFTFDKKLAKYVRQYLSI